MSPVQDEADGIGLDLKQVDPPQIGRTSRPAITPTCSSPSADSPQESRAVPETAEKPPSVAPTDDSKQWSYDPFIDLDAEPNDEPTELPLSVPLRRQVTPAIPPPRTSPLY